MEMIFILFTCTLFPFQVIGTKQLDYSKQESVPLFGASSCRNTSTSSLIACVSLAAESASVSFFYNSNEQVCRWNCIFLASRSCTTYCTAPWSYYGMWCSIKTITKVILVKRFGWDMIFVYCVRPACTCKKRYSTYQ